MASPREQRKGRYRVLRNHGNSSTLPEFQSPSSFIYLLVVTTHFGDKNISTRTKQFAKRNVNISESLSANIMKRH